LQLDLQRLQVFLARETQDSDVKQKELYLNTNGYLSVNPELLFQEVSKKINKYINEEDPDDLFKYLKQMLKEID